jgi:adenine deaminase
MEYKMDMNQSLSIKKSLINTALGKEEADLVLKKCILLNLFTNRQEIVNIGIKGQYISTITTEPVKSREHITCSDYFALPGFIDGHIHVDSTLLTLTQLAKIILPCGTTSLMVDPMEIGNVFGIRGVKEFLEEARDIPLKIFVQICSRVPTAPGLETTGAEIGVEEIREMLELDSVIALGELDPSKIIPPKDEYLMKVIYAERKNKIRVGHAAGLSGGFLRGYAAANINDDHECVTKEEAIERLSLGMEVMIREGSSERNLDELIKIITEERIDSKFLFFCTDDKHVNDILHEGHIDFNVRKAISLGVKPIDAIKMGSYNCARHFRIDDRIGCIAPGRRADIILTKSLDQIKAHMVFADGRLVAQEGEMLEDLPVYQWPSWALDSVHIGDALTPDRLRLDAVGNTCKVRVIDVIKDQIITKASEAVLPVKNGEAVADIENDILKIICVERHKSSGEIGMGFVRGFGFKSGAIASSVAHDHHNIVAIGTNNRDLALAVNAIQNMKGGLSAAKDGKIVGTLPLEIGGLMSTLPVEKVNHAIEELNKKVHSWGCRILSPFMLLSFISLPTVPEYGLTNKGLIDVRTHAIVGVKV